MSPPSTGYVPPATLPSPSPSADAPRTVDLTKGRSVTTTLTTTKSTTSASIAASWPDTAKVTATLTSPSGAKVATSIGKVLVRRPDGGATWYLDSPAQGKWKLQLRATKSSTTATVVSRRFTEAGPTTTVNTSTEGDTVTFTAAKKKNISSYLWDFGDGTASLGQTATHAYANPGTYTAQLMATSDSGAFTLIPVPSITIQ